MPSTTKSDLVIFGILAIPFILFWLIFGSNALRYLAA